jgi:Queuine tRNA-ribosyltransferases, contain PUA domain
MLVKGGKFNFTRGSFSILGEEGNKTELEVLGRIVSVYETEHFAIPVLDPLFLLRSKKTVSMILALKEKIGYDRLLYIPGVSDPYVIPQLYLMGVDVFDNINARLEEIHGTFYTMFGRSRDSSVINRTNEQFLEEMLSYLSAGVVNMRLMEMVERWKISAKGTEILRRLTDDFAKNFESVYPRFTESILASDISSMRRPDIVRFNEYISGEYRKPQDLSTALFIPCSAKKPYSQSKSHIALREALGKRGKSIHEIILTSPLTVVPRELEESYPPGYYDIPVTGTWFADEQAAILSSINSFLSNNLYQRIVLFLPEDMRFVHVHLGDRATFIPWDKSKEDQFKNLIEYLDEEDYISPRRDWEREKLTSMAKYQFGQWIEPYLKEMKVVRMFNQFMLNIGNKPYFIFNQRAGKLTIHKNASGIFLEQGKFLVNIDDFKPTANVYAMGVKECTSDIRQEDEIVMHHNGQFKGVGTAKMSSSIMNLTDRGIAVKVRN